jgi:hypothetical protein
MRFLKLEVVHTLATAGRGDHEVHKGHVVAMERKIYIYIYTVYRPILNSEVHSINT